MKKSPGFPGLYLFSYILPCKPLHAFAGNALLLQHINAGEGLAFHPFEEGAACGRDIGEVVGHASMIEGCDRIAAAADRNQLASLGAGGCLLYTSPSPRDD